MTHRYSVIAVLICLFLFAQSVASSEAEPFHNYNQFSQLLVEYTSEHSTIIEGAIFSYDDSMLVYPNNSDVRDKLFSRTDIVVTPHENVEPLMTGVHESIHSGQAHQSGYTGEGVVVGIFENGIVVPHTDFEDRLENLEEENVYNSNHKTHVGGIIAGGGVLSPDLMGVAPDSLLLSDDLDRMLADMENLTVNSDMTVSNHSYGISSCFYINIFTSLSASFDEIVQGSNGRSPHVPVISAGNSAHCSDDGFGTILGGIQQSKNAILVGALTGDDDSLIASYSSQGPNSGGMIAPTVVSIGNVTSTCINDEYCSISGTSMSAGTVSGVVALMKEALPVSNDWVPSSYRAVLAHTAVDLGNEGPDFTYGFGRVDAMKAIEFVENDDRVYVLELAPFQDREIAISGQSGDPLKVTMGYADAPSDVASGEFNYARLVNDVDLRVEFANGQVSFPYLLDPSIPSAPATRGVDSRNVTEQVEGVFAVSGTHDIVVENKSAEWVTVTIVSDSDMLLDPTAVSLMDSSVEDHQNVMLLVTIVVMGLLVMGTLASAKLSIRKV